MGSKAKMSLLTVYAIILSYTKIIVQGAPVGECCVEKTVGETVYSLVKEGDTKKYGCLDNCIYQDRDMQGKMFCFKAGNLPVDCLEDKGNTDMPVGEGKTDSSLGPGNTDSQIREICLPPDDNANCSHVLNTKILADFYDRTTQIDIDACWTYCVWLPLNTDDICDAWTFDSNYDDENCFTFNSSPNYCYQAASFNGWVSGKAVYSEECTEDNDEEYEDVEDYEDYEDYE